MAYKKWKAANSKAKGSLSVTKAASNNYVYKSTLWRRITGGMSRKQASYVTDQIDVDSRTNTFLEY